MSLSAKDRAQIMTDHQEIIDLSRIIENKITALNQYYSRLILKDDKEKEAQQKESQITVTPKK